MGMVNERRGGKGFRRQTGKAGEIMVLIAFLSVWRREKRQEKGGGIWRGG